MTKVFIDGSSGTTGLHIRERLAGRMDLTMLEIPYEQRHEEDVRKQYLNDADIAFLCLPDDAAEVSATLVDNDHTVVIDTSTRHRTEAGWVYGLPELEGQRKKIRDAKRIANPGCHATGFISLIAPLVKAKLIRTDIRLSCFSLTGYSGGGKKMIAQYEAENRDPLLSAPRMYGLTQNHKHLREMRILSGLEQDPVFCPIVAPYYAGMEVTVPLTPEDTSASMEQIQNVYREVYGNGLIRYAANPDENGFLSAAAFAGKDVMEISVYGNAERILLVSRFDNLGKGASGAAIQNMNLVLGLDETTGLVV
ncbi:MAG: N-acetyl-gamma-glutamyl-phosphate reductase [Solobacterium sp.]|nr:N-acetyl-gamma-glutamyl-phosphate reductase [Solobacterium sp.]